MVLVATQSEIEHGYNRAYQIRTGECMSQSHVPCRMPYINILYLIVKMDLKCRNAIDLPVLTTIGKICKIFLRYFLPYWVKQSSRKVRQHRLNRLAVFCISIFLTIIMIFQTYVLVNSFFEHLFVLFYVL